MRDFMKSKRRLGNHLTYLWNKREEKKKMKKKIMYVVMVGMMVMTACGCGEENNSEKVADDSENNTSTLEGEFVGWADNHTVEVKVEDGPMAFPP